MLKRNQQTIRLDADQHHALEAMLSGKNVFLTGEAGTGKSVVIREFERIANKQLVKLAPTGIAAQNIGGSTIHSFFGFNLGVQDPQQGFSGTMDLFFILQMVEVILIDEISMVRSDLFQAMDSVLRDTLHVDLPFGGKQIIVVGDFCQLPPVVDNYELRDYLWNKLGGVFAFQTKAWYDANFETVMLETIHRQRDRAFIDLLNYIRHGITSYWGTRLIGEKFIGEDYTMTDQISIFEKINQKCCPSRYNWIAPGEFEFDIDGLLSSGSLAVCCTKRKVQHINQACMQRLEDPGMFCQARQSGYFPKDELPTDELLHIKRGERVMILSNKPKSNGSFQHVNGDIGRVIDYSEHNGRPQVTVQLKQGGSVTVERVPWKHLEYCILDDESGEPSITQRETGTFWQLPLAPAYAITIHKSQGQTLDQMHLVLDKGCFAEGQLYTALSRVRSMRNLTLDRPIDDSDLLFDQNVLRFYGYPNPWDQYDY